MWPELWTKLGRNAKLKEKHKWTHEKPQLDNAKNLRGVYFIDPEDKEFKETIKNARKKLETPMASAMPCKVSKKSKHGATRGKSNEFKSQDCVWENLFRIIMRTILQEEGTIHCNITIWYTNIFLSQAMKIPAAKAAVLEKSPAWNLTKVRNKSEVMDEARTNGVKVHFALLMNICHVKNAELETKHQKYEGRVVLRGDILKDYSGSYAVFTEQGSSASPRMRRTSSGCSICVYTGKN